MRCTGTTVADLYLKHWVVPWDLKKKKIAKVAKHYYNTKRAKIISNHHVSKPLPHGLNIWTVHKVTGWQNSSRSHRHKQETQKIPDFKHQQGIWELEAFSCPGSCLLSERGAKSFRGLALSPPAPAMLFAVWGRFPLLSLHYSNWNRDAQTQKAHTGTAIASSLFI